MNKKGKLYVPIVCGVLMLLLISSYFSLREFYEKNNDYSVAENIGSKQAALIEAVREGQRIQLFVEKASSAMQLEAITAITCGKEYLGLKMLGQGSCIDPAAIDAAADYPALANKLSSYPRGPLTDIRWKLNEKDDRLEGTKIIPIGEYAPPTGTFSGTFNSWPTDFTRITSGFGPRDTIRAGVDSTNHPGIDITTNGLVDQKIYSLTDGIATFTSASENSFVTVQSGEIVLQYIHVKPLASDIANGVIVPQSAGVPVTRGQIIAQSAAHGNAPHLHLQIQMLGVTRSQVQALWPGKVGNRFAKLLKSYAVTTSTADRVLLNPICFFEKDFIAPILTQSETQGNPFEACDAYAKDLGLDVKLAGKSVTEAIAPQQTVQTTQEAQTASTSDTVKITKQNLEQAGLAPDLQAAAKTANVDEKLLLAIITQESQGIATAVSHTGCVGIAQFCAPTAANFPKIFTRITLCRCSGEACETQEARSCSPSNDDRFNAQKSLQAMALLHRDNMEHFKGKEQQIAFAIAAYNGGTCPVNAAISRLTNNPDPSWPQVREAILALDENQVCIDKETGRKIDKTQITNYVDKVLRWYEEWGGQTFSGSIYTSKQYGYYELKLHIPNVPPSVFDATIQRLHAEIGKCKDIFCVQLAINAASTENFLIQEEKLVGEQGCLSEVERAGLDFANQVQWCKAAPGELCSCPLSLQADAVYKITADDVSVARFKGTEVTAPIYEGLANEVLGENPHETQVLYRNEDGTLEMWDQAYVYGDEIQQGGSSVPSVVDDHHIGGLGKTATGLVFEERRGPLCALPPRPDAYCIQDRTDPSRKAIFFVDMAKATNPS